jgi:limonene-1,2-epoxide hydrolase
MSPEETVTAFVAAWSALDEARIFGLLAEDIVYHNIPLAPVGGLKAVRAYLAAWPVDECEWEILNIAARGEVVLTERVDRFRRGADRIVVPVMGAFEVRDGRIIRWRDYFDLGALQPQKT